MELTIYHYSSFILSFLVLYRWTLKLVFSFEFRHIGAVIARLILCTLYGSLTFYETSMLNTHIISGLGLNLLFIDEIISWFFMSRVNRLKGMDKWNLVQK